MQNCTVQIYILNGFQKLLDANIIRLDMGISAKSRAAKPKPFMFSGGDGIRYLLSNGDYVLRPYRIFTYESFSIISIYSYLQYNHDEQVDQIRKVAQFNFKLEFDQLLITMRPSFLMLPSIPGMSKINIYLFYLFE